MQEQWTRWEPIEGLARKYYIDSIIDDWDGFKIILFDGKDENKKLHIIFKDHVDSYRNINESYVQKTLFLIKELHGRDLYANWTFFKVTHSNYLKMLSDESYQLSEDAHFIHFCFMLGDNMLDVVASYEPEVKFVIDH